MRTHQNSILHFCLACLGDYRIPLPLAINKGCAHETEKIVRLGLPRIIRLKENAPELDYSSFYGSVATLQSSGDRVAGCSSWHLRFAVYSSAGNLSRRSSCWRWDGTCAFPCRTATSKSCSPSGVCTPTMSRCGDGFSGMRPNCSRAYAAT